MSKLNTSYAISTVSNILDSLVSDSIVKDYFTTSGTSVCNSSFPVFKQDYSSFYYYISTYNFPVSKKDYPDYPICNHFINKDSGEMKIEIAVTGFTKDQLKIKIKDDNLIISGEKSKGVTKEGKEWSKDDYIWKEIYHGIPERDFEIQFQITEKYDSEKIISSLQNGILYINIPMKEEILKKNRDININ